MFFLKILVHVGDTVNDLNGLGFESQTSHTDSNVLKTELTGRSF